MRKPSIVVPALLFLASCVGEPWGDNDYIRRSAVEVVVPAFCQRTWECYPDQAAVYWPDVQGCIDGEVEFYCSVIDCNDDYEWIDMANECASDLLQMDCGRLAYEVPYVCRGVFDI